MVWRSESGAEQPNAKEPVAPGRRATRRTKPTDPAARIESLDVLEARPSYDSVSSSCAPVMRRGMSIPTTHEPAHGAGHVAHTLASLASAA